jgi:sRNA-binding carbon storage regulator CsrA
MLQLTRHPGEGIVVENDKLLRVLPISSATRCTFSIDTWPPSGETPQTFRLNVDQERQLSRMVTMKLIAIDRGIARVGFDAPRSVPIDREEQRLAQERRRT